MDAIEAGRWLSDQELAWTLVNGAIERIREPENELDCRFDRNPDYDRLGNRARNGAAGAAPFAWRDTMA